MKQPAVHANKHPNTIDRWDPYAKRQYVGHLLSKEYFQMLLTCDRSGNCLHSVDYEGHGSLDAPDEIPCGSTLNVKTVGGYEREQYNRQWRGTEDWRNAERAQNELAAMLKKILEEADAL